MAETVGQALARGRFELVWSFRKGDRMPRSNPRDPHWTDEGQGLPLVFVHGFPLSRGCWQPQVDDLSSSFRTVAPDLPGFGGRQAAPTAVTMDSFADDVASLVADLGTGPVVLAGHSMGGYVALAFARRHPELLRGLVLVATRSGRDSAEAAAGRRAAAEKVRTGGIEVVVDAMLPKMLAPVNRSSESLAAIRGLMMSSSRDGVIGALLGMADRPDSTPGLRRDLRSDPGGRGRRRRGDRSGGVGEPGCGDSWGSAAGHSGRGSHGRLGAAGGVLPRASRLAWRGRNSSTSRFPSGRIGLTNAQWFLLVGCLMLAMGLNLSAIRRLPVTSAIIYLAVGVIVGPTVLALFHFNPLKEVGSARDSDRDWRC